MDIISQYRKLHENAGFCRGTAIKGYLGEIESLIRETGAETVMDYGCGKAQFYRDGIAKRWGVQATLYDPGVPEFSKKPQGTFDGVICTDVLEHVEDPEAVIKEILGYATKFAFLAISCVPSPSHKKLPDGRPLHISVHPKEWWIERISAPYRVELRFAE